MQEYKTRLARFAEPGNRDFMVTKGGLTYWARAAGLTAEDVIADARAVGVTNRDGSIRTGWETARPKFINGKPTAHCTPRAKPQPPRFTHHVRNILAGADSDKGTPDLVSELSPCVDWIGKPPEVQTALFVRAAFRPDEKLFVFRGGGTGTKGEPWINLRNAVDWADRIGCEGLPGDLVKINPFTGAIGKNKNGRPSYVSQDCLAAYPFALIEFDAMPMPMQCAFWRNFILSHGLASALVSLTFSGGKSLHGLLSVGCRTLDEWQKVRKSLIDLFAADTDERFRIDTQALHPLIGTRLPGVLRRDNGKPQELLYLNPEARNVCGLWGNEPSGGSDVTSQPMA